MPNDSPKFDHLVVLMMENHSLDNLLGYLYHPDNPPPFDRPPRGQTFNGVYRPDGGAWTNPVPAAYQKAWGCSEITLERGHHFTSPWAADPYHDFADVEYQLYGYDQLTSNPCGSPPAVSVPVTMQGFVENYINAIIVEAGGEPTLENTRQIMDCFTPCPPAGARPGSHYATVPVLSTLALNYAVCDNWYAPLPSATMCNRSFANSAQSSGWVNNANTWANNTAPTIFNKLMTADLGGQFSPESSWRIYHDELDPSPLTYQIHPSIWPYEQAPYRVSMDRFYADAACGTLPAYAFIEPRIVGADNDGRIHNDQHPVCDIRRGENLINLVYQAVAASPCWERTFLIITYDEHGGYFDHVPPAPAVPPFPGGPRECGFKFDRFGIRVPAVLVSPYIEAGTVFHPSTVVDGVETPIAWDHTAIIKTLRDRWGITEPLTQRDASSIDLSRVLTLDKPRPDEPLMLPLWHLPRQPEQPGLNSFQRDVLKLHAARLLARASEGDSADDVIGFLKRSGVIRTQ